MTFSEDWYIGKSMILGLTRVWRNGAVEQDQLSGTITRCNSDDGIVLKTGEDESSKFRLPYSPEALVVAPPGIYCLKSVDQVVKDPDYMSSWTMQQDVDGTWFAAPDTLEAPNGP